MYFMKYLKLWRREIQIYPIWYLYHTKKQLDYDFKWFNIAIPHLPMYMFNDNQTYNQVENIIK